MNIRALRLHHFGPVKPDEYDWWNRPYRVFEPGEGATPLDIKSLKQTHPLLPPMRVKHPYIRDKTERKIRFYKCDLNPLMWEFWRAFLTEKRALDTINRRLMRVKRVKREKEIANGRLDKAQDRIISMLFQRYAVRNKKINRMFVAINHKRAHEYRDFVVAMIKTSTGRQDFKVALNHQLRENPFNIAFSSPNEKKRPKLYRDEAIVNSKSELKRIRKNQREHSNYIYNILIKSSHVLPELYKEFKDIFDDAFREFLDEKSLDLFDTYLEALDRRFGKLMDSVLADENMFNTVVPMLLNSFIDEALVETSEINVGLEIDSDISKTNLRSKPTRYSKEEVKTANLEAFMAQATIPNVSVEQAPLESLRRDIQGTMSLYPDQVNESKRMIRLYAKLSSDSKLALEAEFMAGMRDIARANELKRTDLDSLKRSNELENNAFELVQTSNLQREISEQKKIEPRAKKDILKTLSDKYGKDKVKKVKE